MTKGFEFSKENHKKYKDVLILYPKDKKRSALLPLLDLAQRQNNGYLSKEIIEYIAQLLDLAPIRVYEVASFYSMFNLKPVGKYHIQVCGTTPCWLRGADKIMARCKKKLGIVEGETTSDKKFTLNEVECLGGCVNAPIIQINDDYYEDLHPDHIEDIIDKLKNDSISKLKKGSQIGRKSSEPVGVLK